MNRLAESCFAKTRSNCRRFEQRAAGLPALSSVAEQALVRLPEVERLPAEDT